MTEAPTLPNSLRTQPDARGHFGAFGGRYVCLLYTSRCV